MTLISPKFGAVTITRLKDENGPNVDKPKASANDRSLRTFMALSGKEQSDFGAAEVSLYESVKPGPTGYSMFMVYKSGQGGYRDIEYMVKDCATSPDKVNFLKGLLAVIDNIPSSDVFNGIVDNGCSTAPFSISGEAMKAKYKQSLAATAEAKGFAAELAQAQQ